MLGSDPALGGGAGSGLAESGLIPSTTGIRFIPGVSILEVMPVMPGQDVHVELAGRPALLQEASERALAYLDGLAGRPVAPPADAVAALRRLDFSLPGSGMDPGAVLALLDEAGSPATVASAGPRYFGFVTGGALPIAQAAAWLSIAWDQNVALTVMTPAAATLNAVALRWVAELLGLPAGAGGGFVTGATMANTTCLAA